APAWPWDPHERFDILGWTQRPPWLPPESACIGPARGGSIQRLFESNREHRNKSMIAALLVFALSQGDIRPGTLPPEAEMADRSSIIGSTAGSGFLPDAGGL